MPCEDITYQPLDSAIRAWIRSRARADELLEEWQRLESEIALHHGLLSPREASRRDIPQGNAMRLLDLEYRSLSRALRREATILTDTKAATVADALAKIELGLRMLEGEAHDEPTTNIQDGFRVLRAHLCDDPIKGILGRVVDG